MTYQQAPFTLDPLVPMADEPAPSIGVDEFGMTDAIADAHEGYTELAAGPLRLNCEDTGLLLTATVEGADDATVDWGDGDTSTVVDGSAEHTYRAAGQYTVIANAKVDGVAYAVAKVREMRAP